MHPSTPQQLTSDRSPAPGPPAPLTPAGAALGLQQGGHPFLFLATPQALKPLAPAPWLPQKPYALGKHAGFLEEPPITWALRKSHSPGICVCPCPGAEASEHLGHTVWEEALHSASSLESHRGMRTPQPGGAPFLLSRPPARSAQEPGRA